MNFYEHTLVAKQDLSTAEVENIEKLLNSHYEFMKKTPFLI